MENENSEIPAEIENVKKDSVESPINLTKDNNENAPILQNEANTPSSHRQETPVLNADTTEEGKTENNENFKNKESTENKENNNDSNDNNNPDTTIENENNSKNNNVTSQNENNDVASPVKDNNENNSNDITPPTTLPIINVEENVDLPAVVSSNENNEPILSVESKNNNNNYEQKEIIPVQINEKELPIINLDADNDNVVNDNPAFNSNDHLSSNKLHPINTDIKQVQSANSAPINSAGSAGEVITNAWTSVSNYLWSWFEPQPDQQQQLTVTSGPKSAPLHSSNTPSLLNATSNNNNNNNNNNTQPSENGTSYYTSLFSSFFGRPATTEDSNSNTLTIKKKSSSNSLSSSRLNLLSQQAMMSSIKFIGREEQEDVQPIINQELTDYLRPHLPIIQRESSKWLLRYSTAQHGISLNTLYQQVNGAGPLLLAIRDTEGNIFGAYVSEPFHVSKGFYGTRECFLWKYFKGGLKMYPTSGSNEYFIHSEADYIAIGGGNGNYGLYIDEDIQNGQSSECTAFFNEPLSSSIHFQILSLEIWSFEM